MTSTDHNKPTGKRGRRDRKAEQRNQKADQPQSQKPDLQQHAKEQVDAAAAPIDATPRRAPATPADATPLGAPAAADIAPVSFQTIANAYGDYTRKSLEQTRSFVEKLTDVRSLDKAMEVQTEFAKQTYRTFVTESQKIRDLHGELAKQTFKPLQGFVAKTTRNAH
jgi:hypothetical protein